jgi:hypothetical protein
LRKCWSIDKSSPVQPPQSSSEGPNDPKQPARVSAETVGEVVREAESHADFEGSRLERLRQRAGWLLALNGVILGLIASQAHEMLDKASVLGSVGRWIAAGSLLFASVSILVSLGLALGAILKGRAWCPTDEEIDDLPKKKTLVLDKVSVQRTFLDGLAKRILVERASFDTANCLLRRAFYILSAGLVAVTIYIGVFAVRTVEHPCTAGTRQPAASPATSVQSSAGSFSSEAVFIASTPISNGTAHGAPAPPDEAEKEQEEDEEYRRPVGKICTSG